MIIDFHAHVFPDKIAEKTVSLLASKANIKPYGKATLAAIKSDMKANGIDKSVLLPVATSPKQVGSINRMAVAENGKDGVIYFGAVHPDSEDIPDILDGLKKAGISGIKIHPDYQGEYFDSPKYIKIMYEAAVRGLITVTHAGLDIGYPDDIHCTPDRVLNVLKELDGIIDDKLVLAHMGGFTFADEVTEKLVGRPVYMDTSFVLNCYPKKCERIIKAHSADKVLFATDYPWADAKKFVALMNKLDLSDEEKEKIFHKNAERLLSQHSTRNNLNI